MKLTDEQWQQLTKSSKDDFDCLRINKDDSADIHTSNGVTIEQLEEVIELMKKVRDSK